MIFLYTKNHQHFAWSIKVRVHQRVDKPQNPAPGLKDDKCHMAIFSRDSLRCHKCGEYTDLYDDISDSDSNVPSIDNLSPKSKGGKDYPTNLITCGLSCNESGKDKIGPMAFQEHSKTGID